MGFLKGLAVSLLSFLLFLSLSIFGLVLMLNQTILNPDFIISQVNKLDVSALAGEFLREQMPQEDELIGEAINDSIVELEPWIKEQAGTLTYSTYDYLKGESESLSVVISLEPVKDSLNDHLSQAEVPQAEVAQNLRGISATFEFDDRSFPTEVQATIGQVRQIIGYIELGYKALIGFIVLLVVGIILINRNVKSTTRSLGTTSLTYGVLGYAGVFITNRLLGAELAQFNLPPSLQAWLSQFIGDFLSPVEIFSIGLAIAGVVLIIVSFVYKREAAAQAGVEG